jgi:hypothetical protein
MPGDFDTWLDYFTTAPEWSEDDPAAAQFQTFLDAPEWSDEERVSAQSLLAALKLALDETHPRDKRKRWRLRKLTQELEGEIEGRDF